MRHKLRKEALDVIVQKIANDVDGVYLTDLLKINEAVHSGKNLSVDTPECQAVVRNMKWFYGYENEISKTLESIKSMLKKRIFNNDTSYVTIISCMANYCVLLSIFDASFDMARWDEVFDESENKRLRACLEVLQRHCPDKLEVCGYCEARRYIRMWDSAYNW